MSRRMIPRSVSVTADIHTGTASFAQMLAESRAARATIGGHPYIEAHREHAEALHITVCAECGRMRSVLFLEGDRWFCTSCRSEGTAKPTQIAVSNPARGRR